MNILDFWELTPYEIGIVAKAYQDRMKYEYEQSITMAYMTAYWTNQWQSKRKPLSLDKILNTKKEEKVMTDKQMFEQVKKLNKLFGGE